jgi:hypothetical protein
MQPSRGQWDETEMDESVFHAWGKDCRGHGPRRHKGIIHANLDADVLGCPRGARDADLEVQNLANRAVGWTDNVRAAGWFFWGEILQRDVICCYVLCIKRPAHRRLPFPTELQLATSHGQNFAQNIILSHQHVARSLSVGLNNLSYLDGNVGEAF